jgi:hypothetical protein
MRPRGEVREKLAEAARALVAERQTPVTWRDLAEHACVGYDLARRTVTNMASAGELERVGTVATGRRPQVTFAPPRPAPEPTPHVPLQAAVSGWASI